MDEFNPYQSPRSSLRISDVELLRRFRGSRDESAFAELVKRHGPMVLAVCRRVLQHAHDAEDAFQATFLVLVRRARFLRSDSSLASWLYGVGRRTALKAKAMQKRHQPHHNDHVADQRERSATADGLMEVLDFELARLPARQRAVVILCDLEGKTYREAADELRLALGSVSSLLVRARQRLRERLTRRGFALGALGGLAMIEGAGGAPVPPGLATATLKLAGSFAAGNPVISSPQVAALVKYVSLTLALTKTKILAGLMISAAAIWLGTTADSSTPVVEDLRPKVNATLEFSKSSDRESEPHTMKSARPRARSSLGFSVSIKPMNSDGNRFPEAGSQSTKGSKS